MFVELPVRRQTRIARTSSYLFVLLTMLMVGCGSKSERLTLYPIDGKVVYKGEPLANAMVALHPLNATDPRATRGRATSDAQGNFKVSTYNANDGAPAGEYAITVECYKLVGSDGSFQPGPNFLPTKYSQPTTSKLTYSVKESGNSPLTIDLK